MTLKKFLDSLGSGIKESTIRIRKNDSVVGYVRNNRIMVPDNLMECKYISIDFEKVECPGGYYRVVTIYIE